MNTTEQIEHYEKLKAKAAEDAVKNNDLERAIKYLTEYRETGNQNYLTYARHYLSLVSESKN